MFKDKVSELEKMVKALSRKVLSLESEIEYIKNNTNISLGVENIKLSEIIEEKKETATEEVIIENSGSNMNSFDDSEIKLKCSTPKESQNKVKKTCSKDDLISCGQCNYKCKKEKTLQKHIVTKHEEHQCKECKEKLPSFMDLLKHVSKHHFKDEDEKKLNAEQDELFDNMLLNGLDDNKEYVKASSFVFRESMLDEFVD